VRGPGESQLETDRRLVRERIKILKGRLGDVAQAREVQRQARRGVYRAALVGYTNAGKSSILRALANDDQVFVEDRLFATLDPLTREIPLDDKHTVLVTDTVGFIRKLPHHLVASFRATLQEVRDADVIVHVIDASHPMWEEQRVVVDDVLHELAVHDRLRIHAFNKMDALEPAFVDALRERVTNLLPNSVFVSALAPGGLAPLSQALLDASLSTRPVLQLRVPIGDGRLLALVYRESEVLERRTEAGSHVLWVRAEDGVAGRLVSQGVTIE
jgi:GTP-binding protein HflX